jgi:hypothetical protein
MSTRLLCPVCKKVVAVTGERAFKSHKDAGVRCIATGTAAFTLIPRKQYVMEQQAMVLSRRQSWNDQEYPDRARSSIMTVGGGLPGLGKRR